MLASGDTWLSAREALDAWHDDRALVAAYEGYADEHADLYQDDRTRLALGKGTTADSESRAQPGAVVGPGAGQRWCAYFFLIIPGCPSRN